MKRTFSQINWAVDLNTGKWITADRADRKPGKGRYRCLDGRCGRDLTVARSKYGRQHFRHFRNSHAEGCVFQRLRSGQDTHKAAQVLLLTLFSEALKRNIPMPLLVFDTANGRREVLPFISAARVVTEWECPVSKRKADVALLDETGRAVLLVEVWHTHAVDLEKRIDLSPCWWIEVEASRVLADPTALIVRNHGNLPDALAMAWEQFQLFAVLTEPS